MVEWAAGERAGLRRPVMVALGLVLSMVVTSGCVGGEGTEVTDPVGSVTTLLDTLQGTSPDAPSGSSATEGAIIPTTVAASSTIPPPERPPGLPLNFPPLELPQGSVVLSSDTREVGDGGTASETAFDSPVGAKTQYEALLGRLREQGYEILESSFTQGERFAAYLITAQREGLALTVTGGAGAVAEQSEALANAENPYVVTVGPGG